MAKNNIMVRVIQFALFTCFVGLCSCSNSSQQGRYYRYYVGTMKIENPVLVEFENCDDMWFVCPDSALYCCNDSDWVHRDDVFPYLPVVEYNPLLPTYFPQRELRHLAYFQWSYIPFYECKRIQNHTICRFYYDVSTFECYMQAINGKWSDWDDDIDVEVSNPNQTNIKSYSAEIKDSNQEQIYRMVVRQKYNIFQIMRLKMKYRDYFESNQ